MYLKKIEIFGFKSFADKTEIVFEPGVTCVVGPNGCGKSNISDSIRWVLGERSAKLLRGSKMEDVIFSGTEFRKPLNIAEVSLTIDNTDQKLPIQYEEVVITRRLHRSGESEYLLNRTPCRLKDIQDLILDTGIGSNSYSMIEQGRIDHILNAEAEERRFLIEEAAGISKYKVKKEEALRKLERTEQNLLRLNDITSEVERNIRYAERQAQRAERYKEQFERLKTLEIKKAFFESNLLIKQLKVLEDERSLHSTKLNELEEKVAIQNTSAKEVEKRLQELETSFFDQESARSEAKQELNSIESQEHFNTERIDFLKLAAEKALGEVESLTKRHESLKSEIENKQTEHSQLSSLLNELEGDKNQLELKQQGLSQKAVSTDEQNRQQAVLFDLAHRLSDLRNLVHKMHAELIAAQRTKTSLNESYQKLSGAKESYLLKQNSIKEQHSDYQKKRSEIELELAQEIKNREQLERNLENVRNELTEIKTKKTKLEGQIRLLEELARAGGPDPKKIAAHHDRILKNVTKAFLDLVQIEPGYELAAEAALSEMLCAVVTNNLDSAQQLLHSLTQSGFEQATILINEKNSKAFAEDETNVSHPLIKKRLRDVVRTSTNYSGLFRKLLHGVYVIDDLTSKAIQELAPLAQNYKFVAKTGSNFGPNLQINLRNVRYTPERSAFARKEELTKLSQELGQTTEVENKLNLSLKQHEAQIVTLKEHEQVFNRKILESQSSLMQHEGTLTSVHEYVNKIDEEMKLISHEIKSNQTEVNRFENELKNLNVQLAGLEAEENKEKEYLQLIQKQLESHQISKNEIETQMSQITSKIDLTIEKQQSSKKTAEFLKSQLDEITNHISTLSSERQVSFQKTTQLQEDLERFVSQKENVAKRLFEHSVQAEQLKRERAEVLILRNQALEEAQKTAKSAEELKQKFHNLSLQEMELNHQKNSILQELQSRYKITLSLLNPADFPLMPEEVEEEKTEIERLREKLDSIGTVNLLAIDEYHELKERYDFLNNQKTDLTESKESLLEAIRKINRTTKRLFEETLVRVRESFREYFRTLFGGGYADLVLIDEQNPFESGLDIVARPPGKKLQHITLLSGGEKALTAIALLLSLFSVKPSPFCVLDEVDAPLDEANNDRFLNVLKPFLITTQFIVVTHSRKTIAVGDALYGVTMQEAGVSKLVSVKLSHDSSSIEHSDGKVATELNQILN